MKNVQDLLKRDGNPPKAEHASPPPAAHADLDDELTQALERLNTAIDDYPRTTAIATNTFHFGSFAIGTALAAMFVVVIAFAVMIIELSRQDGAIRDLAAWKDQHNIEIGGLQSDVKHLKEK